MEERGRCTRALEKKCGHLRGWRWTKRVRGRCKYAGAVEYAGAANMRALWKNTGGEYSGGAGRRGEAVAVRGRLYGPEKCLRALEMRGRLLGRKARSARALDKDAGGYSGGARRRGEAGAVRGLLCGPERMYSGAGRARALTRVTSRICSGAVRGRYTG